MGWIWPAGYSLLTTGIIHTYTLLQRIAASPSFVRVFQKVSYQLHVLFDSRRIAFSFLIDFFSATCSKITIQKRIIYLARLNNQTTNKYKEVIFFPVRLLMFFPFWLSVQSTIFMRSTI